VTIGSRRTPALLGVALITEAIYLGAAARLPWWRYGGSLRSWRELLGPGWMSPAACLAAVGILLGAYCWGWRIVRRAAPGTVTGWVLWGSPFVFALTLFWVMPVTSDLFTYLVQAHLVTDWHANPLVYAPLDLGYDPLVLAYPTAYSAFPSAYGQAWILLSLPATLGAQDVAGGLFYLKGLASLALLGCAWLLDRIRGEVRPQNRGLLPRQEVLYLFAWNPLVLYMSAGEGHNDIAMMFVTLLALWCLVRERWGLAFGLLALSVWIKYVSVVLFPLCLFHAWRQASAHTSGRLLLLGQVLLVVAMVTVAVYLPITLLYGSPPGRPDQTSDQAIYRWSTGVVQRLLRPSNWAAGEQRMANWMLKAGGGLLAVCYISVLRRSLREHGSLLDMMEMGFVAILLVFVLGAARSQPWHLIWPASLAGLSGRRWAWPVTIGLSAVMLATQIWVEWGAPGWDFVS